MIKAIFMPKDDRSLKENKSFYIDTHDYAVADKVARKVFSKDPSYSEYKLVSFVNIDVVYPRSAEFIDGGQK